MASFSSTPFAKRLRAAQPQENDDGSPRRSRQRPNMVFGVGPASAQSLDSFSGSSDTGGSDITVAAKDYGDRFVPSRDTGNLRTSYHLIGDKSPSTPSKNKLIPTESDALKEQANTIFASILHTEVTPPTPGRSSSPIRQPSGSVPPSTPTRRRLFNYNSPTVSNPATPTRRLDTPTDEAYSMSPVRAESRQLLESPRRKLRSVCKTPYRVLDAPELADDFYLSLVDWSSTNVLGVGLGACVYLWTAHTAAVSKLCDLTDTSDTISSLSWVQKVRAAVIASLRRPIDRPCRAQPWRLERLGAGYTFTMLQLCNECAPTRKRTCIASAHCHGTPTYCPPALGTGLYIIVMSGNLACAHSKRQLAIGKRFVVCVGITRTVYSRLHLPAGAMTTRSAYGTYADLRDLGYAAGQQ